MKSTRLFSILAVLVLVATSAAAQDRHDQFNDHDRQAAREWYRQHHDQRGFRERDRLTIEQERRIQLGQPLDRELYRRAYSVPRDLLRRLPPPPRHLRYMIVGHHVVLVDRSNRIVRDVIHLHD
jgi:Ni/Co efflux regulator RcnB